MAKRKTTPTRSSDERPAAGANRRAEAMDPDALIGAAVADAGLEALWNAATAWAERAGGKDAPPDVVEGVGRLIDVRRLMTIGTWPMGSPTWAVTGAVAPALAHVFPELWADDNRRAVNVPDSALADADAWNDWLRPWLRRALVETRAGGGYSAAGIVGRCVPDRNPRVLFGADLAGERIDAEDEARMLELATTAEPDGPEAAPMLDFGEREPDGLVPAYLLDAYAAAGGPSVSRGRGGPAAVRQRLWLHALTAIVPTDRTGDVRRFGPLAMGEYLIDHVWPYGWDYQRSDWPTLLNAIRAVNAQPLRYRDRRGVAYECHLVAFTRYPTAAPDPRTLRAATFCGAFTLPVGMAKGPTLSRAALEHAGILSGPAQRLVAAWAFYRGRYLSHTRGKGRRFTSPTLPRARRDAEGRYLDANGAVILNKRGKPIERFTDPRVVLLDADGVPVGMVAQAARERNPALDRAPPWPLDRWRRETGGRATDKRMRLKERRRVEAAFDDLRDAGILDFEKLPGRLYRPIPPGDVGQDPDRRELLEHHRRRLAEAARKRADKRRDEDGTGLCFEG